MSDTPETDVYWDQVCDTAARWDLNEGHTKLLQHARRLECERDEAREGLAEEIKFHHRTHSELVQTQCQMQGVIREREEALAYADKLAAGLPEGMLPKDVEVLRDANLALAVALEELNSINAERAAHRGTRKAWVELDDNRQILEKQLTSERALADRLADSMLSTMSAWITSPDAEQASASLTAWKETRGEKCRQSPTNNQ